MADKTRNNSEGAAQNTGGTVTTPLSFEGQSLEELLKLLDELVTKMESEDSLEEMFRMYQTGIAMSEACDSKISKIEKEVEIIRNRRFVEGDE